LLGALLDHAPLLELAFAIIGGPYRLSSIHARNVRPGAGAQPLHRDVEPGDEAWPLAGFILMIDAFTELNGATRFVSGSGGLAELATADSEAELQLSVAYGPAGSLIVFDGSTWHGHGANATNAWRRSVQGAFIPATATPAVDFRGGLPPEVWRGMPPNARSLLSPLPQS
jgi:ectoine hydroxylase-related dioxygenase (phytanoyl-CoA dioxygenase family)